MSPRVFSLLISLISSFVLAVILAFWANVPALLAWLIALNIVLFSLMAKDKRAALAKTHRTPESTLLFLAFLGGTPAIFAGRKMFRHKTIKEDFVAALYGVVGLQALLLLALYTPLLNFLARW